MRRQMAHSHDAAWHGFVRKSGSSGKCAPLLSKHTKRSPWWPLAARLFVDELPTFIRKTCMMRETRSNYVDAWLPIYSRSTYWPKCSSLLVVIRVEVVLCVVNSHAAADAVRQRLALHIQHTLVRPVRRP